MSKCRTPTILTRKILVSIPDESWGNGRYLELTGLFGTRVFVASLIKHWKKKQMRWFCSQWPKTFRGVVSSGISLCQFAANVSGHNQNNFLVAGLLLRKAFFFVLLFWWNPEREPQQSRKRSGIRTSETVRFLTRSFTLVRLISSRTQVHIHNQDLFPIDRVQFQCCVFAWNQVIFPSAWLSFEFVNWLLFLSVDPFSPFRLISGCFRVIFRNSSAFMCRDFWQISSLLKQVSYFFIRRHPRCYVSTNRDLEGWSFSGFFLICIFAMNALSF